MALWTVGGFKLLVSARFTDGSSSLIVFVVFQERSGAKELPKSAQ